MIYLEEIKDKVAKDKGYKNWSWMPFNERNYNFDEVATEYSKQCCDEQIKACAENVNYSCEHCGFEHKDSEKILNTPNVVTTKA